MFPDIPKDNIKYDLLRTGNAELTTNKILERGYLEAVSYLLMTWFNLFHSYYRSHLQVTIVCTLEHNIQKPRHVMPQIMVQQQVDQSQKLDRLLSIVSIFKSELNPQSLKI